jgi:hypothetical protein
MDPLSAAGTFATIVGLVCNYRAEKNSEGTLEFEDFMQ